MHVTNVVSCFAYAINRDALGAAALVNWHIRDGTTGARLGDGHHLVYRITVCMCLCVCVCVYVLVCVCACVCVCV